MKNQPDYELLILPSGADVAREGAARFAALAKAAIAQNGRFTVALSGGTTPRDLFQILAALPYHDSLDWSKVYIFFGDERTVPPGDPDSNFRMADETLLSQVPIPPENIFRMRGEAPPAEAAAEYARQLRDFFHLSQAGGASPESYPRLVLVLLGMGPDGHTASLFPGTAALQERSKPVTHNFVPKLNTNRLTLTAPAINRAANIIFLVAGDSKAPALKEVLEGEYQPQVYPSQLIRPSQGQLIFLVDQAAAAQLKKG
jgi:6-phosphogluconolactonase